MNTMTANRPSSLFYVCQRERYSVFVKHYWSIPKKWQSFVNSLLVMASQAYNDSLRVQLTTWLAIMYRVKVKNTGWLYSHIEPLTSKASSIRYSPKQSMCAYTRVGCNLQIVLPTYHNVLC